MAPPNRREFITRAAAAVTALVAGPLRPGGRTPHLEAATTGYTSLPTSPTLDGSSAAAGVVSREVWPGRPTELWTYGGSYPSPTIRVRRGEIFTLRLDNHLPEPTNIHWHGLLVPSDMDGLPMDLAPPGASLFYAFRVEQRAGTYWYHPHPDMRTGFQVYSGMAGFLIVEDDEERALGLPADEFDVPILLQDRRLFADRSFRYAPTPMDLMNGYLGDVALANGAPEARLPVAAALYRLRFLNGSNARIFRIAFADRRGFDVIATDGGLLERPRRATSFDLAPGERLEVLADFSRDPVGGSLALTSLPFALAGPMGGMGGPWAQGAEMTLLRFDVDRTGFSGAVPARLAPPRAFDAGRAPRTRRFLLDMGPGMMGMMGRPTINGRSFDAHRIDERVPAETLEVWEVVNRSTMPHPFHAHGVQFHVLERAGARVLTAPQDLGLKDTVLLWPGETVRLGVRVGQHRGLFVMHCHNLEHEDTGMMSLFEIV